MSKLYKKTGFLLVMLIVNWVAAQDLVHYWNFNDNSSEATITTPTIALVSGSSITAVPGGISAIDFAGGTGQNFNILNLNARNGNVSGTHLRFNDPIGGKLQFALPTTGFTDVIVKFATRRSGSGAGNQLWSYSIDGTNFVSFITVAPNNGDPALSTLDFTSIVAANDNPNFKLQVAFEQGDGGTAGNNRFDNFTLDANPIGGDVTPPTVIFTPVDASTIIAIDINPTILFNEDVRLISDTAIDDTNVDALVELRLDDASGVMVPFDATFTSNTITINPTTDLANNQVYYIALLPNQVEDLSNNALTAETSATFTTMGLQSDLAMGDLAFVAYRMSATANEDGVAFVTFVDIAEGTSINFTDSKYTTNAQPQCPDGIVWTAADCIPAGSVITIQTNALVSNLGTVTGSGFGLSSNGDQVIVYTGTANAPNYITALTSNGWQSANIECGGSLSMIPMGLVDGSTSLNTSTSPGNVAGNTANAFYNGSQVGTDNDLRDAILNPANWTTSAANTAPQTWPIWNFPKAAQVQSVVLLNDTTIEITFTENLDPSANNIANYAGIDSLSSVSVLDNVATLNYSAPFFVGTNYSLVISNILDSEGYIMTCPFTFNFDGTLANAEFNKSMESLVIYPNPSEKGIVHINRKSSIDVFDVTGQLIYSAKDTTVIDTSLFASGLYLIKTSEGIAKKLLVK